jgi:F-type H+-transporting ATPase subunit gamma
MPSLIDLRRRIRAVKNTQQITKAMKMVAASKLRRAQMRIVNARPYAVQMQRVLGSVAARVDPSIHPLLERRELRPDSQTLVFIVGSPQPCVVGLVGRKGRDYFGRRAFQVFYEQVGLFQKLRYEDAQDIARTAIDAFVQGQVARVVLIYNEFKSVMSQRVVVDQILPIARADVDGGAKRAGSGGGLVEGSIDYLYEPSPQEIFNQLLPRYVEVQIYRALLESNAAFFAAQMTAMDTATKNSADMIGSLTLYMNKVRQAAITREIIEVVSGSQAL